MFYWGAIKRCFSFSYNSQITVFYRNVASTGYYGTKVNHELLNQVDQVEEKIPCILIIPSKCKKTTKQALSQLTVFERDKNQCVIRFPKQEMVPFLQQQALTPLSGNKGGTKA